MTKPSIEPARWTPPSAPTAGRPLPPMGLRVLETSGHGTEDVLVHPDGRIVTGVDDGRVLAIDPVTGAETGAYCLRRVWLTGERRGVTEPFGQVLPGFPDNISTGEDGNIWVAIASARDAALDRLLPRAPWIRRLVWALPSAVQPQPKPLIRTQSFAPDGSLVHDIAGKDARFAMATGVRQHGSYVWLGSLEQTSIAVFDLP